MLTGLKLSGVDTMHAVHALLQKASLHARMLQNWNSLLPSSAAAVYIYVVLYTCSAMMTCAQRHI